MILYDAAWCDAKHRRRIVGRAMEMRPSVFSCDECRRLVRAASGHSLNLWWVLSQYIPDEE